MRDYNYNMNSGLTNQWKRRIVAGVVVCCAAVGIFVAFQLNNRIQSSNETSNSAQVEDLYSVYSFKSLEDFEEILSSDVRSTTTTASRADINKIGQPVDNDDSWIEMNSNGWRSIINRDEEQESRDNYDSSINGDSSKERRSSSYPFIVCKLHTVNGIGTVTGTGQIEDTMASLLGIEIHVEEDSDKRPWSYIFNTMNQTCVYTFMAVPSPPALQQLKVDEIIIQPLLPAMKFRESTWSKAREVVMLGSQNIQILAEICPNFSETIGKQLQSIAEDIMKSLRSPSVSEKAVDKGLSSSSKSRQNNLRNLMQTPSNEVYEKCIADENILQMYRALTFSTSSGDHSMEKFAIDLAQATRNHVNALSICIDYILSFLSNQPEVCSLSITDKISTVNAQAQWISQGGTKQAKDTPFFDVGLDGKGQVVGVSDTGLGKYKVFDRSLIES